MTILVRAMALVALAGVQAPAAGPAAPAADPRDHYRIVYPRPVAVPVPDGRRAISSLLRINGSLRYGTYVWHDLPSKGEVWVRVDLDRQTMSAFRGGDEIGTAVVLFGADGRRTPRGAFQVLERDRDHVSSLYDAPMPFMLRLTSDGVAIHASEVRRGAATHGCVGVPPAFAELLFAAARRGTRVYVV